MRAYLRHGAAGVAAALLTLAACRPEARACGGGSFGPLNQTQSTFINGHRVAIAMSPTQTVLWDQIEYSGAPQDFAWVMPVKAGATIVDATAAWIEVLDAATQTVVTSPDLMCGTAESTGCGCSNTLGDKGGSGNFQSDNGVTVVHQGTIGPYMTVTLASSTPGGIAKWLTDNGYNIPADIQPILDDYTMKGMDFIALRLKPGQTADKMTPVRVTTPGLLTTFPMRMLQAGAGANVALKVFVISESRVEVSVAGSGFTNTQIKGTELTWDFDKETSNYEAIRSQALAANGGKTWITAYSKPGLLLAPTLNEPSTYIVGGHQVDTIAQAYFDQAMANQETAIACSTTKFTGIETSTDKVVDLCPPGQPCSMLLPNEIDSALFECGGLEDLSAALIGLHPANVVITRLEAELPRAALAVDLTLSPAMDTKSVNNNIKAQQTTGALPDDCTVIPAGPAMGLVAPPSSPRQRGFMTITITLAAAALALARRARRQRPLLVPARAG